MFAALFYSLVRRLSKTKKMNTGPRPRRAYTLLELLIVVGILALIAQLTLPAVQRAREAARQSQCQNRMRQVSLALHMYHDRQRKLPAGSTPGHGERPLSWGYAAAVLDDLDAGEGFDRKHLSEDCYEILRQQFDQRGVHPGTRPIEILQCPSDPHSGDYLLFDETDVAAKRSVNMHIVFPGNYLGVSGNRESVPTCYSLLGNSSGNGLLYTDSHIRFGQIRDGLSKTFILGERVIPRDLLWGWPICGGSECEQYLSAQRPLMPGARMASNAISVGRFSSYHLGGVHFAFADGAVGTMSFSTDEKVMHCLSTRDVRLDR